MGLNIRKHMLSKYACYGLLNSTQATVYSWAQTNLSAAEEVVCGSMLCNNSKIHLNSCVLSLDSAFPLNYHKSEFIFNIISKAHTKGSRSDFVHGKHGRNLKLVSYQCKCKSVQ